MRIFHNFVYMLMGWKTQQEVPQGCVQLYLFKHIMIHLKKTAMVSS